MNSKTKKLVIASLMAAITCIATMIIHIPSPLKGYLNLGDCVVLLSGWMLSPVYGFFAAGLGSALADVFSGYALYAPATFIIKGVMALIAFYCFKLLHNKLSELSSGIISGASAELFMVLGYFIFEGFLYGFLPSAVNILPNALQGVAGLVISLFLITVFKKNKLSFK
ncbi:MAG: ECF transporter S component [Ruminococcaceae bacterium]|nr:ECF transporter S component [Oscillospiraceae bacterium]